MISENYCQDAFIADFTNFVGKPGYDNLPCQGVMVVIQENGIIPSFVICNYIFKEKKELDATLFNKKYLIVSTPGVEPLDPFDASYFDQDNMLTVKEETGAFLKAVNEVSILTPALLRF